MPAPAVLIGTDGRLTPLAITVLAAVARVEERLLASARIRPARTNWLWAPWYRAHRGGGALTVGRTIWFNGNWFNAHGPGARGDGSPTSTWRWLLHLAHEVGHLPQAERHGLRFSGRARYVARFAGQYLWRAVSLKADVHDGAPLEIEADRGRWVLSRLAGPTPLTHPLVGAVIGGLQEQAGRWLQEHASELAALHAAYPPHGQPTRSAGRS